MLVSINLLSCSMENFLFSGQRRTPCAAEYAPSLLLSCVNHIWIQLFWEVLIYSKNISNAYYGEGRDRQMNYRQSINLFRKIASRAKENKFSTYFIYIWFSKKPKIKLTNSNDVIHSWNNYYCQSTQRNHP